MVRSSKTRVNLYNNMSYITTIKEGISTVHKNWQLVLVHLGAMILSCISFFLIVGIPIAIAFILFGLDLTEILRLKDIPDVFRESAHLLRKYFAMAVVIITSLLFYIGFIGVVWLFTIAATIGILKRSILNEIQKFTLRDFFKEGRTFFFPIFSFTIIIGAGFVFLAFMFGLISGSASSIVEIVKMREVTLGLFLSVFFSLALFSLFLFSLLITLSIIAYGFAHIAFHRYGAIETVKRTGKYLYSTPSSIVLYIILLSGHMLVSFIAILIGSPLALIPIIGPILSMPYQLISYVIQGYVGLIMLASLFIYYYKTGYPQPLQLSIQDSDTSLKRGAVQVPAHEETEETQRG